MIIMVLDEKELYYLFTEIREDICFIRVLNAWSRYKYAVNLIARELCVNKINSQTELTDEIKKSLSYFGFPPSKQLREDEINWFLFRNLAPRIQRVVDNISYGRSTEWILQIIINTSCKRDEPKISEHMKQANKHFSNLHSIIDMLDFNNILSFKEQEIRLSLHSNDRIDELYP